MSVHAFQDHVCLIKLCGHCNWLPGFVNATESWKFRCLGHVKKSPRCSIFLNILQFLLLPPLLSFVLARSLVNSSIGTGGTTTPINKRYCKVERDVY
jgi:hypothetical protein